MVLQTAPAQRPQQSTSQSHPAQQIQQPLTQNQHNPVPQLRQIQAQQQAIQGQRTTGASSTIQNRSATSRLSTAANARPLGQQGQHLQQGRGVQVSVPLQAGVAQANMVSFSPVLDIFPWINTKWFASSSPSRILPNPKSMPIHFTDYHQILLKNRLTKFALNYWSANNNQRLLFVDTDVDHSDSSAATATATTIE